MIIQNSKKNIIKVFSLCIICLVLTILIFGCSKNKENRVDFGDTSNVELINKGTLKVGICPEFPPFEFTDENKLVGYDIDIAEMIGDDLGLNIDYVKMPYDDLLDAVANNKVDVAISSIDIDSTRRNDIVFSNPYYTDQKVIAVTNNSKINFTNANTYLSSNSTRIAYLKDSSGHEYVLKNLNNLQKVECDSYMDIVNSLTENKADICIIYQSYFNKGECPLNVINKVDNKDECAIAIGKHKDNLLNVINKDLDIRLYDGSIGKLIDKWFYKD